MEVRAMFAFAFLSSMSGIPVHEMVVPAFKVGLNYYYA